MNGIRHIQLTLNNQLLQKFKNNVKLEEQAEQAILTRGGGLDTVSFTTTQSAVKPSENYNDVLEEFSRVYGEGRSLEQAKLGVEYMERLLACEDLPAERRAEFENEKVRYEMMVVEFENWDKAQNGKPEKFDDVMKEMEAFIAKYKKEMDSVTDRNQLTYQHEYVQVIHSFYQRMYNCSDLTPDMRSELDAWVQDNLMDFNYLCDKLQDLNKPQGERFDDVYNEMMQNVPDRTSTIEEKELAISYIDRMLACPDISPELKEYWENKKDVIEMEIQNIKNEQLDGSGEKLADIWKEFSEFGDKYFSKLFDMKNLSMDDKFENRMTYYRTYLSFCRRALNSVDITPEERREYQRMIANAERDIANWQNDYYNSLLEN